MITKDIFIYISSDNISGVTKKVFFVFCFKLALDFPNNYKNVIPIIKEEVLHVTDTVKEKCSNMHTWSPYT